MLGSKDAMATIAVRDPGVPVTLRRDEQSEEFAAAPARRSHSGQAAVQAPLKTRLPAGAAPGRLRQA
jgi:hypothetical protein